MGLPDSVLITGGGGMLAQALIAVMAPRGARPVVLTHAELDITLADSMAQAFHQHQPRLVLNCAAYTKVDLAETEEQKATEVNGLGVGRLAEQCARVGARLVHFSTDFVFDGRAQRPYREDDATAPLSAYGRSKLAGEQALAAYPDALTIRTAWLYGPGGPSFPQAILNAARAGKKLTVVNDQIGSPTYTADVAAATLELVDRDASGIFHVVNTGTTTWFDFAAAVLQAFEVQAELEPITSADWAKMRPGSAVRPAYSVLDCARLRGVIGRDMRRWHQPLGDYARAMRPD